MKVQTTTSVILSIVSLIMIKFEVYWSGILKALGVSFHNFLASNYPLNLIIFTSIHFRCLELWRKRHTSVGAGDSSKLCCYHFCLSNFRDPMWSTGNLASRFWGLLYFMCEHKDIKNHTYTKNITGEKPLTVNTHKHRS